MTQIKFEENDGAKIGIYRGYKIKIYRFEKFWVYSIFDSSRLILDSSFPERSFDKAVENAKKIIDSLISQGWLKAK